MKCKTCGTELPDGDQFCTYCGSPIETTADIPAPKKKSKIHR